MKHLLFSLILFFNLEIQAKPTRKISVQTIVKNVQKIYDRTKDFSGDFEQTFHHKIFQKKEKSEGSVQFLRPGFMRWDYSTPTKKSFIVDGKNLWLVQYEDTQAFVDRCFKQDGLTASIAFLWGQGKIVQQFDVKQFDGVFGAKDDYHLELIPKRPTSLYRKLILVIDPKSHHVKQSIVVDLQGNVNQFAYKNVKFNRGLKQSSFSFLPPKGMQVSPMPGSCGQTSQ